MIYSLRVIAESFCATVLAGAVLVWFYNRVLTDLRESYVKKAFALGTLPMACAAGILHAFAMIYNWPHVSAIAWLGAPLFLWAIGNRVQFTRNNREAKVLFRWRRDWINYGRFSSPVRSLLKLFSPINCASELQWVRHEIAVPNLPKSLDRTRIVFLTDFHVHPTLHWKYFRKVVQTALTQKPDFLLLGGDFVSKAPWRNIARKLLSNIAEHPRVYAVRGNHDFWTRPSFFATMLRDWGVGLVSNEVLLLEWRGCKVALVGIEHPYAGLTPRQETEMREKLDRMDEEHGPLPRIALVHNPKYYTIAERLGCHLAMAGHSHGGQICLPLFGTTIAACDVPQQYARGRGKMGDMVTLTCNGIGVFFPVRILCPPQILEVVLRGK